MRSEIPVHCNSYLDEMNILENCLTLTGMVTISHLGHLNLFTFGLAHNRNHIIYHCTLF